MTIADLVLLAFLVIAVLYGWRVGTINVVAKIGAVILAYNAGRTFSSTIAIWLIKLLPGLQGKGESNEKLSAFLSLFIETDTLANRLVEIITFVIIFVVVCWVVKRIAYALTSLFGRGLLGKINHVLGAICGLLIMLAIILISTDIIFPAIADMGIGNGPRDFLNRSNFLLPFIKNFRGMF